MDEGCSLGRVWQGYHCTWWTGRAVQAILALVDSLRDRIPVHLCCGLSLYHFTLGSQSLHCPHCRHVSLPLCSCPQPATYFLGEQGWDGKNEHAVPRDSTGGWASPWCWPGDRMLMEVSRALKSSSPAERLCFCFFLIAPSVLYHVGMNRAKHSECCPRLQGFSAWKLDLPLWHSSLGVKAVCKCSLVSLSRFYSTGMKVVYFLFLSSDKGEVGICFLQFPIKDFKWCPK